MRLFPAFEDFAEKFAAGESQVVYAPLAADLDTPVSLMLKLADAGEYSFVLESVTGGEVRGRYSIVGLKPDLVWKCQGGTVEINAAVQDDPDGWESDTLDPLDSLRSVIKRSRIDLPPSLPASSAGLYGYLGYDMVRLVEDLPDVNEDRIGVPDSILIRPSVVAVLDGVKGEVTVVSPAWPDRGLSARDAYTQAAERVMDAVRILEQQPRQGNRGLGDLASPFPAVASMSRDDYCDLVERAKEYIRAGDIFQVVLGLSWRQQFELPPFSFYRALRRTNPSPFMFFFNFGEFQVIGASPEILVRVFDRKITIRPIAGTRPRGDSPEQDLDLAEELLADEKERAEHLMLLDLGRNDVGCVSKIGSVRPTEQFIVERYSHVMHIVSNVVGELAHKHDSLSALIAGLPAGTVSGAPKIRAMEIIDELEQEKRGVYGGGVGYFSANGDMDMCIALRTAVLKGTELIVQAGGGIVFDSDPDSEWQEAMNKSEALKKASRDAGLFVEGFRR